MKTSKKLFVFLLAIAFISSCSVSEDDEIASATDANGNKINSVENGTILATDSMNFRMLLTDSVSKQWETSLFTLGGSTAFTGCRLDDVMLLFNDGTYNYNGGQLCGAEDNKSIRNGIWELDYSNKTLTFDKASSDVYVAEIIGLVDNELRVKGSYMNMEVRGLYLAN